MADTKKRLQFADMMKGRAILGVLFYHLTAPCGFKYVLEHITENFLIVFFFFSGYFYKVGKRSLGQSIGTRFKATMFPFVKYSLIFWVIGSAYLLIAGLETIIDALCCLRNFYGGCIWNRVIQNWFGWEYHSLGKRYMFLADFWFLLALLLASVLFFVLAEFVLPSKWKTLTASVVLFAVTGVLRAFAVSLPYNLQLVPFWTAFLLLESLAQYNSAFELKWMSGAKGWISSVIALAAGVAIAMLKEPSVNLFRGNFAEGEVVSMLLTIASSLLFIWGLGNICRLAETSGIRVKELSWLGSHSLLIYLFHMFFAWIICIITGFSLSFEETVTFDVVLKSLLLGVVCLGLCILLNIIVDKIKAKIEEHKSKQSAKALGTE